MMATASDRTLLAGEKVRLRALEAADIDILYAWENDPAVWDVSGTIAPFSRETLLEFIDNQQYDIYRTGQMRFVVCRRGPADPVLAPDHNPDRKIDTRIDTHINPAAEVPVGFIDLFDFDPVNLRAGVGILIYDEADRGKGYAHEALDILCRYASRALGLHQLYAGVETANLASERLFLGAKFAKKGVLQDWSRKQGAWRDEIMFQRIF